MSLRVKLVYGALVVSLGGLLGIGYGILGSRHIRQVVTQTVETTYPALDTAVELQQLVEQTRTIVLGAIETEDADMLEDLNAVGARVESIVGRVRAKAADPDLDDLEEIRRAYGVYTANARRIVNVFISEGTEAIVQDMPKIAADATALLQSIQAYRRDKESDLKQDLNGINMAAHGFVRVFVLFGLCFSAVMILVMIGGNRIARLVSQVTRVTQEIASGNLDLAHASVNALATAMSGMSQKDELVQLFEAIRTMTKGLHSLIAEVQKSGIQLNSSANEIAVSAAELEAMAGQQAKATHDVSGTASLISSTSQELVTTMTRLSKTASQTGAQAADGRHVLDGMSTTMQRLIDENDAIVAHMAAISDKTKEIGSIVTTITKVADRANLLSLNAAIEAEKAGEYGLGFSVVAQEIRRLADEAAASAVAIKQLIDDVMGTMSEGLKGIQRFTEEVNAVATEADSVNAPLVEIIAKVENLTGSFEQVSEGVMAQAERAQQISYAMTQLSATAERTSENLRSFRSGTVVLNRASERLGQEVSHFKVGDAADVDLVNS